MGKDLISVIVAYYKNDNPDFFEQSLTSVLSSSYRPLEVVLVCDGERTDRLEKIVDGFGHRAAKSGEVVVRRIYLEKNSGPAAARNRGIESSSGEFIAILDADDQMVETRLKLQVDHLKANPHIALVGTAYVCVDETGQQSSSVTLPLASDKIRRASAFMNPIANPTVMVRSEVLKKYKYPEHLRFGEDYWLWVEMLRNGLLLENLSVFGIRYRASSTFANRRIGLSIATSDLKNKLRALAYQDWQTKILALIALPGSIIFRLLPKRLVSGLYLYAAKLISKLNSSPG